MRLANSKTRTEGPKSNFGETNKDNPISFIETNVWSRRRKKMSSTRTL